MEKLRFLLSCKGKMENYINAVTGVGAIAEAAYLPEVDTSFDGLILCGGSDIHPKRFGEEIDGSVNIDYERDKVEFALLKAFVDAGKPVLGVCRGCQIVNVFFGGTLYQDIKEARSHSSYSDFDLIHRVRAVEGSVAEKLYGTEFVVNSYHHQAVRELGKGLRITMRSSDDLVVEGIEHASFPVFAVQWHPERMCFSGRREDTVDGAAIFEHFIRMCKE